MPTTEPTPQWLSDWLAEPLHLMVRRFACYYPEQKRWQRWEWDARPGATPRAKPEPIPTHHLQLVQNWMGHEMEAPAPILTSQWTHPVLAHDPAP